MGEEVRIATRGIEGPILNSKGAVNRFTIVRVSLCQDEGNNDMGEEDRVENRSQLV